MLYRRKNCPECMKNLCYGCYLPVEVSSAEHHVERKQRGPLTREDHYIKALFTKRESCSVDPEVPHSSHKLPEVWDGIGQLIEEVDLKLLKDGENDPRKKCFQVSAGTLEPKPTEAWKCDMCRDRRAQQLPPNITAGEMGIKCDPESLQLRHE